MKFRKVLTVAFAILGVNALLNAQQLFHVVQDAQKITDSCYILTPDASYDRGAIWHDTLINLNAPIQIEAYLNFGTNDPGGADGIALVLHKSVDGFSAIAGNGGGIGYGRRNSSSVKPISPSFAVEFDTWDNTSNGFHDIVDDHIALVVNGETFDPPLYGPVPATPSGANIEDGNDHHVKLHWNPNVNQIQVWFECIKIIDTTYNLIDSVFNGDTMVYWGFTAGTGASHNAHRVCLTKSTISQSFHSDTLVCPWESITLHPAVSYPVTWLPHPELSCTQCQHPSVTVDTAMLEFEYYFISDCDTIYNTLTVLIDTSAVQYTSKPVTINACTGDTIVLTPQTNAQITWHPDPALSCTNCQNPTVVVDTSDLVLLYYYLDSCGTTYQDTVYVIVDTAQVSSHPVTIEACEGDTVILDPGTNVQVTWYPDSSLSCLQCQNPTLIVGGSTRNYTYSYYSCGKTYEDVVQVNLKADCIVIDTPCTVIKLPNAFTPNGDGLNDEFKVLTDRQDDAVVSSFRIYNRWGELIFESNDLAIGWDGTYRDEPAESGVYTWVCNGRCAEGTFLEYGNVTLIR